MKDFRYIPIAFLFAILSLSGYAQKFKAPTAFGLKGPVKECIVTTDNKDPYGFRYVRFTQNGKIDSIGSFNENKNFVYSSDGYLTNYLEFISGTLFFPDDIEKKHIFIYKDGVLFKSIYTRDPEKCHADTYYYDQAGYLTGCKSGDYKNVKNYETDINDDNLLFNWGNFTHYSSYLQEYKINKTDKYGNYTSLQILLYNLETEKWEKTDVVERKITYWENQNNSSTINKGNKSNTTGKIIEPAKDLTIADLIKKPLGVMTGVQSIWEPTTTEVRAFIEQRSNWKFNPSTYKIDLFSNRPYYENKERPLGFNMTYHNEPFFSVTFDFINDKIESYSYSFHRYSKGKIPKNTLHSKQEILASPQWTKEEAIAFAEQIVNDLSKLGIKMRKIKNLKNDIYTMGGIDTNAKSYYHVRIYKGDFFGVTLDIYGETTYKYKDELKLINK